MAGTIAALAGNGIGVAGAGNFRLHIVRALGDDGRGYESDVRRAVEQCRDAGAHIINLSLGGPSMSSKSDALYTEVSEQDGVLIVAAAGNQGSDNLFYPASHPSIVSVAAVFEWNMFWGGSNWGTQIEVRLAFSRLQCELGRHWASTMLQNSHDKPAVLSLFRSSRYA